MRVGFLVESVLALAVGLGLAREFGNLDPGGFRGVDRLSDWLELFESVGTGAGVVYGLGAWLEAARGRGPAAWGLGRWTWSVVSACFLLNLAENVAHPLALGRFSEWWSEGFLSVYLLIFREQYRRDGWVVAAVLITGLIARPGRGVPADAREWVGRAFAVLRVAQWVATTVLGWFEPGLSMGGMP